MPDAFVVLVLLTLGGGADPASAAITDGLRAGLPKDTVVLVNEAEPMPDDAGAISLGETVHATIVVEVAWDADHTHAHVHLHRAGGAEWLDHELSFAADEPMAERGRSVGLDVTAMLPTLEVAAAATPENSPVVTAPRPVESLPPRPPRAPEARTRWGIDLAALGRLGLGGPAEAIGGEIGGRVWVDRFLVRVAFSRAMGRVADADTTATWTSASAGVGLVLVRSPVDLAARLDVRASRLSLVREEVEHARWLAVLAPRLEITGWMGAHAGAWASIGSDVAFGTTTLVVAGRETAVIPRVAFAVELGARLRF